MSHIYPVKPRRRRQTGAQPASWNPKNHTAYAKLNKLAADPRVESIEDESVYADEPDLWIHLAPGWQSQDGTISIHANGETTKELIDNLFYEMKLIERIVP